MGSAQKYVDHLRRSTVAHARLVALTTHHDRTVTIAVSTDTLCEAARFIRALRGPGRHLPDDRQCQRFPNGRAHRLISSLLPLCYRKPPTGTAGGGGGFR